MKPHETDDILYAIVDELGPDLSAVRFGPNAKEDRLYITPIELGLVVGTIVLGEFCLGFVKGVVKYVADETGKTLGKTVTKTLTGLVSKLRGISHEKHEAAKEQARQYQIEIERVISTDLPPLFGQRSLSEALQAAHAEEVEAVRAGLSQSGFPEQKSQQYAERLVIRIRQEWPAG